ncbi:MAG: FAD-dependent oxidoreductase [Nanoarchaeota archaeon]|nr:FAD-dependent oxidoreductase [Nanoarchaeota archaeon]
MTKDSFVFTLDIPSLDFQAGQFLTFILKDEEGKPKPRSYSLFNAPSRLPIQLLVECIPGGLAGEQFRRSTPQTEFSVMGPLGKFIFQKEKRKHIFIATNTGIAPIHSMIAEHLDKGFEMTLIFGARLKEGLYFHEEFSALDKGDETFVYKPTLSREEKEGIAKGYVQKLIDFDKEAQYYICGSDAMVKDTVSVLQGKDIPKEHIHYEVF